MKTNRRMAVLAVLALGVSALGLSGCSGSFWGAKNKWDDEHLSRLGQKKISDEARETADADSAYEVGEESAVTIGGEDGILSRFTGGGGGGKSKDMVRADKLFAGALDVVMGLPIRVASREGGFIATDWKVDPQRPNARYRINIRVTGRAPYGTVKVAVLKQVRAETGEWQDRAPDTSAARHIRKKIRKLGQVARP